MRRRRQPPRDILGLRVFTRKSSKTPIYLPAGGDLSHNYVMDARASALLNATPLRWVALSEDESRIVAEGETFDEAAANAEKSGLADPILMLVPENWSPRVL